MRFPRTSGILLHPTCLPGPFGIGDFGPEAFSFVDFLKDAGQKLWQVLPLNPTGYGDSPFQCFSAYAGNHLLISVEKLQKAGILEASDLRNHDDFPQDSVDFEGVIRWKTRVLSKAATRFKSDARGEDRRAFDDFCAKNVSWLPDFALFMSFEVVGVAEETMLIAFATVFGAAMFGLAIAFGLGGQDLARKFLEKKLAPHHREDREDELSPL